MRFVQMMSVMKGFCYQWLQCRKPHKWKHVQRLSDMIENSCSTLEWKSVSLEKLFTLKARTKGFCVKREQEKLNLWSSKENFKRSKRHQQQQRLQRISTKEWRFESDFHVVVFNPLTCDLRVRVSLTSEWVNIVIFGRSRSRLSHRSAQ